MDGLYQLQRVLRIFRHLHHTIPSQRIETFLAVARGYKTQREVAKSTGVSVNAAGRNLNALSGGKYRINDREYDGLGLLTAQREPREKSPVLYSLSNKGEAVLAEITGGALVSAPRGGAA